MLKIDNLHAAVDGKAILNGLDLEVKDGEVHAIMGPNGSGKSTLAQVLAGRDTFEVTAGSVDWDGTDLLAQPAEERARAVSFSAPYYQATQAIVGPADSPAAEATSLSDLQGLRLGVATGSTSLVFVEEIIVPDEAMQVYNSNADAVAALMADQIDAIVTDLPTALYLAAVELDDGAVFGQFPVTEQTAGAPWGLVFELDNPLVDCANLAILNLRQSGELDAITEEWMTASVDVPFIDIDG